MNVKHAALALAIALSPVIVETNAHAGPRDVATARKLANSGVDAFEAGDCARALELLARAESLHSAPVHLQYMARCYKKQGKWVSATEAWRKIIRSVDAGSPAVFQRAAEEARGELPAAEAKLGPLARKVEPSEGAKVLLDGKEIPAATIGVPQVIDPGPHEVTVSAPGYATKTQRLSVESKGSADVTIILEKSSAAGGDDTSAPSTNASASADAASGPSTLGIVLAAGGGAALIGGVVALLSRNGKRSELQDDCPNGECRFSSESEFRDRKATVEDLTLVTNVLFVAGGVLTAAGVTVLVIGSGDSAKPGAEVAVRAVPGAGGVSFGGRF